MKKNLLLFLVFLAVGGRLLAEALPADHTIVVANSDQPESLELARYYMEKRGIPSGNLYALPAPETETISWTEFIEAIYNPLQAELIMDGWIGASASASPAAFDHEGRRRERITGHRMAYLVVCRGIPLRIAHDQQRLAGRNVDQVPEPLRTNRSSVDSQLSLLSQSGYEITAFHPNPLFQKQNPSHLEQLQIVRVSRLDGPSLEDAKGLVDGALLGESSGLRGRAYIDLGGVNEMGDEWLRAAAETARRAGFAVSVDESSGQFSRVSRFDDPALYFGWYAPHIEGPFLTSGFRFPPGAIAFHIHSFSAQSVRSGTRHWVGPFVARGVTATLGNVYEPYLEFSHRPDLFLEALMAGKTVGEAAYFSLPVVSWQSISIGDPLYRPFPQSGQDHADSRDGAVESSLDTDATALRKGDLSDGEEKGEEAVDAGRNASSAEDSELVSGLAAARLHAEKGERRVALEQLEFVRDRSAFSVADIPLVLEIADFLLAEQAGDQALALYENLLSQENLPDETRRELLRKGVEKAAEARRASFMLRWRRELQELEGR